MLSDKHLKVIMYEADGSKIFPNTDIKGGVTITIRDVNKDYGEIGLFTAFNELNSILEKVGIENNDSLSSIMYGGVPYAYTDIFRKDYPQYIELAGKSFDVRTNALDNLYDKLYFDEPIDADADWVQMFGLFEGIRKYKWLKKRYITSPANFNTFKVFVPKSNGSGALGEVLSTPLIGLPLIGHTQSFISIGNFETEDEAKACLKYVKSKFARTLLGVLKITQDNPPSKWKYVPLQDFTSSSDIDWSQSVAEIDVQLYRKYGLSEDEIAFIEEKVKSMDDVEDEE